MHEEYLRWTLELGKCTPGYLIREVDIFKIRMRAEEKACKFEEKKRESENRVLVKECMRDKENDKGEGQGGRKEKIL